MGPQCEGIPEEIRPKEKSTWPSVVEKPLLHILGGVTGLGKGSTLLTGGKRNKILSQLDIRLHNAKLEGIG